VTGRGSRPGFTIVELLVVLGVLVGIITTLVVGVGSALRRARVANTDFLLTSLSVGLAQFRIDVGYLPPVLGDQRQLDEQDYPLPQMGMARGWARDAVRSPQLTANPDDPPEEVAWGTQEFERVQRWYSVTSLADYLVGPGDRSEDGYGVVLQANGALPASLSSPGAREVPPYGIRHPGQDGAWGAFLFPRAGTGGNGTFAARNLASTNPAVGNLNDRAPASGLAGQDPRGLVGEALGPYLELKSDSLIGAFVGLSGGKPVAAWPGQPVPEGFGGFGGAPKTILDYFGNPIHYYRRGYRNDDPRDIDRRFSLADVVVLRPSVFAPGEAVSGVADRGGQQDSGATRAALGAEYALFTCGPDRRWSQFVRADPDGFNEDNIVRFGP
jgi:type II secretory pathway pseudopilin PulG